MAASRTQPGSTRRVAAALGATVMGLTLLTGCVTKQVVSAPAKSPTATRSPPSPTATSSSATLEAAYSAYDSLANIVADATSDYDALAKAAGEGNLAAAKSSAVRWRDALYTWDGKVRKIAFPAAVQPEVNKLLETNGSEIAALDSLAKAGASALPDAFAAVELYDAAGVVAADQLRRALGKPHSAAVENSDLFYLLNIAQEAQHNAAVKEYRAADQRKDVAAMLAATGKQRTAMTNYLTAVNQMSLPPAMSANLARLNQAADAVLAGYQREFAAKDYAELAAVQGNSAAMKSFDDAKAGLSKELDAAAQ